MLRTTLLTVIISVYPACAMAQRLPYTLAPEAIQSATDASAVGRFREHGVVADDAFMVDDLARIPDALWPEGVSFDAATQEIVFDAQRVIIQDRATMKDRFARRDQRVRNAPRSGSSYSEREENFVGRMAFWDAWVDESGNVTLDGAFGYMRIFVNERGQLVYLVHPPDRDVAAFYPTMYVALTNQGRLELDDMGTVASPGGDNEDPGAMRCKCDTDGCGSGCTHEKCESIKTCSGGCGSCAWTLAE